MGNPRLKAIGLASVLLPALTAGGRAAFLFQDNFSRPDGLVTNEYAFYNPGDSAAARSADWEMDSGSFFIQGGAGWTGIPDDKAPNAASSNGTNSAIFRLNTQRGDFTDVEVSFALLNQGLSTSPTTPAVDWDGIHIWLRYASEFKLYYCSMNRRDNTVVIKKKVPGGPSNGGTYYELSPYVPFTVPYGTWQNVKASVKTNSDGSVTLSLYENGTLVVSATDRGTIGGAPYTEAGRVGIRGDNANLKFKDFLVNSIDAVPTPTPTPTPTPVPTPTPIPVPMIHSLKMDPVMPLDGIIQVVSDGAYQFTWKFSQRRAAASAGASSLSQAASVVKTISTSNSVLALGPLQLTAGDYSLQVIAVNSGGVSSAPAQADVTLVDASLGGVRVFPNPWRQDRTPAAPIRFDHVTMDSVIKIFTLSGHRVKELRPSNSTATWDLTNESQDRVGSGLYLYSITNGIGQQVRGKLAILR